MSSSNIIRELYILMVRTSLCGTKQQSYESFYNLFVFICNNDLYLLRNYPEFYRACGKKRDEVYLDLLNHDPNKKEKPLWRILEKSHQQFVDNYIQTLGSIPGKLPFEIKRSIASYI
jgi:hypothetical protein